MNLPDLYHWSPRARRGSIEAHGLLPDAPVTTANEWPGGTYEGRPMLCLAVSPSEAWSLSGAMDWTPRGYWDCWQITLADGDNVHVLPCWGATIHEVRCPNPIPPERVTYIGTRTTRTLDR